MDGYWVCSKCLTPTAEPTTHLHCPDCEDKVKDLEKKLKIAVNGLKRVRKIAFPRPKVTDMINRYLKRL